MECVTFCDDDQVVSRCVDPDVFDNTWSWLSLDSDGAASSFFIIVTLARLFLPISLRKLALVFCLPFISAVLTLLLVLYLKNEWPFEIPLLSLIIYGCVSFIIYTSCFLIGLRLLHGNAEVFILTLIPAVLYYKFKKLKILSTKT